MSVPFPWADVMRFGLGTLCLAPKDFWQLTVPELQAAASALAPPAPVAPGRAGLDALLRRYPDKED